MTKQADQRSRLVRELNETDSRGKPLVLEIDRGGVYVRAKGERTRVAVSIRGAYESALNRAKPIPRRMIGMTARSMSKLSTRQRTIAERSGGLRSADKAQQPWAGERR